MVNKRTIISLGIATAIVLGVILFQKPGITGEAVSVSLLEGTNLSEEIVDRIVQQYSLNLSDISICDEEFKECFVSLSSCLNDFDKKSQEYSVCKKELDNNIKELEETKIGTAKITSSYDSLMKYTDFINRTLNECKIENENCFNELHDCMSLVKRAYEISLKLQEQGICDNIKDINSYKEIGICLNTILENPDYLKIIENFSNLSKKIDLIIALIS